MIYVVSDSHFYHDNIRRFDNRPYSDIEEMNQTMIENWNAVVTDNDTVYILGDLFFRVGNDKVDYILSKLNGKKSYIYGNHERSMRRNQGLLDKYDVTTHEYLDLPYTYEGEHHRVVMSHYPIPMFNGHFRDNVTHLYGHVHRTEEQAMTVYQQLMNFNNSNVNGTHQMINVGVMMTYMGYEPKPLNYVIRRASEQSERLYEYFNTTCKQKLPTYEEFRKQEHLWNY